MPLQLAPNLPPAAVDAATSGGSGGDDGDAAAESYYAFPTAARLAAATEEELRGLGLGYRASYVRGSAQLVESRGASWLKGLRAEAHDPAAVRDALCTLPGVGPKVADCVALFSLDATAAIPVDIHVWQIACRDLDPTLSQALSLTPAVYALDAPLVIDGKGFVVLGIGFPTLVTTGGQSALIVAADGVRVGGVLVEAGSSVVAGPTAPLVRWAGNNGVASDVFTRVGAFSYALPSKPSCLRTRADVHVAIEGDAVTLDNAWLWHAGMPIWAANLRIAV